MRTTRSTGLRCGVCAAAWDGSTARYCGRCGQPLRAGPDERATATTGPGGSAGLPAGRDGPAGTSHRTRLVLIVVSLGAALVVVSLLVGGGLSQVGDAPTDPESGVDLPERDVLGSGDAAVGSAEPADPDEAGHGAPSLLDEPVTCRPEGCERWRLDLGPGTAEPVGDRLIHAGDDGLTAVAIDDGTVMWSDRADGGSRQAEPVRVDGDPAVVIVVDGSAAGSRDPATGEVQWRVALPGRASLGVADGDTVLLFGEAREVRYSTSGWTLDQPSFLVNVDRATGEPRWLRTDVDLLDLDPTVPLVRFPGDVLAALDPATGESRWRRAYSPTPGGSPRFAQGEAWVAIADGGGVTVLDRHTGEVERQVAIQTDPGGWLQIIDGALLVGQPDVAPSDQADDASRQAPHHITVLNLDDDAAPVRTYAGVVDIHRFGAVPELTGGEAATGAPGGLVLGALDPGALVLHRLDPSGEPVWRRHIVREQPDRPGAGCCWSLEADPAADRFLAKPPGAGSDPIRVVAETGEIVGRFERPQGLPIDGSEQWYGRVVVGSSGDGDPSVVVAGPWGAAEVVTAGHVVLMDPVVMVTESGLLAIDTGFLAGHR